MNGFMKVKKAAGYAGVCENTLRSWRKLGLKCYRVSNNVVLYKATDIDEFIEQRLAKAVDPVEEVMGRVRKSLRLVGKEAVLA